jgi:hypothetical protein
MKPKKLEFARVYLETGEGQAPAAQDVWVANPLEGFTYMVHFWRGGFHWMRVVPPSRMKAEDYGPCPTLEFGVAACQKHWEREAQKQVDAIFRELCNPIPRPAPQSPHD